MVYSFTTPCTTDHLKEIRMFTNNCLSKLEVGEEEGDFIVLAVDEICANLIIHSNNSDAGKVLELSIERKEGDVVIKIYDQGTPFNPTMYKDYSLQELVSMKRKGGLGLKLVNRIMDSIEYTMENSRNVCTLIKKVGGHAPLAGISYS